MMVYNRMGDRFKVLYYEIIVPGFREKLFFLYRSGTKYLIQVRKDIAPSTVYRIYESTVN